MTAKRKEKAVAVLTINGVDKMTASKRKQIVTWLHKQADGLQTDGANYAARFRARYLVKQ